MGRNKGYIAAALVLATLVSVLLGLNQRIEIRARLLARLSDQVMQAEEAGRLRAEASALETELAALADRRPRNLYRFFSELAEALDSQTKIQRLTIEARGNFQIDSNGREPLRLMTELQKKDEFEAIRLPRISREPQEDGESFTLSGVFDAR